MMTTNKDGATGGDKQILKIFNIRRGVNLSAIPVSKVPRGMTFVAYALSIRSQERDAVQDSAEDDAEV